MANVEESRRTDRGNIRHKAEDILIIGLCTLLCNGNDFVDMEAFGKQREEWLRGFLALPNGIPDSDTFRRVFDKLNPEALSGCLYDWPECNREEGSVIAVDGKTIRGSGNESHKAYHVVSAFVAENRMILGELVTEEKSNEITAVPELLASLNIEGSVVTADAMSCQKKIVEQIQEGGADYVIGLKGNQSALVENVSLYFESFSDELPKLTTRLKDHGRIKKRKYRLLTDLSWLEETEDWKGLHAVGMATAQVVRNGNVTTDTRYFISSITDMEKFIYAVRRHWSVEISFLKFCKDTGIGTHLFMKTWSFSENIANFCSIKRKGRLFCE